jgi:hypothetical protein
MGQGTDSITMESLQGGFAKGVSFATAVKT